MAADGRDVWIFRFEEDCELTTVFAKRHDGD